MDNDPLELIIGRSNVIRGWDEGILGVKVGEKRKIIVSPS
jgi:FK506-binding protein 2